MSEADGMDDAVDSAMRTGLMVAARIGEQLAKMREEEQRKIAAAEEQRARQLQERFDAQREAARAQLAPVARDDWWDKATPEMIERDHETATAWKAYDPQAAQAAEVIREQVQTRYGIDVNNTWADEASVSAALTRAQQDRSKPKASGPKRLLRGPTKRRPGLRLPVPTGKTGSLKTRRSNPTTIPPSADSNWPKASKARETGKRSAPDFCQTDIRRAGDRRRGP